MYLFHLSLYCLLTHPIVDLLVAMHSFFFADLSAVYCLFRCFLVSRLAYCLCAFCSFACVIAIILVSLLYSRAYSPDKLVLCYFPVLTFIHLRASQLLRSFHKPLKGSSAVVNPISHGKSLVTLLFRYDLTYMMPIFLMVSTMALIKFPRGMPCTYEPE